MRWVLGYAIVFLYVCVTCCYVWYCTRHNGMSNILSAMASFLSGCTDIFVIVLQTAVLRGGNMACFAFSMYCYTFSQLYLQHSISFQEKILTDIIVKVQ